MLVAQGESRNVNISYMFYTWNFYNENTLCSQSRKNNTYFLDVVSIWTFA